MTQNKALEQRLAEVRAFGIPIVALEGNHVLGGDVIGGLDGLPLIAAEYRDPTRDDFERPYANTSDTISRINEYIISAEKQPQLYAALQIAAGEVHLGVSAVADGLEETDLIFGCDLENHIVYDPATNKTWVWMMPSRQFLMVNKNDDDGFDIFKNITEVLATEPCWDKIHLFRDEGILENDWDTVIGTGQGLVTKLESGQIQLCPFDRWSLYYHLAIAYDNRGSDIVIPQKLEAGKPVERYGPQYFRIAKQIAQEELPERPELLALTEKALRIVTRV